MTFLTTTISSQSSHSQVNIETEVEGIGMELGMDETMPKLRRALCSGTCYPTIIPSLTRNEATQHRRTEWVGQ